MSDPEDRGCLALAAVQGPDLLRRFAQVSDGRSDQGRDHPVAVVLTLCAAAVLAGMGSFTAIGGWVADVPVDLLAGLSATPAPRAASKTTLWRVVTGVDAPAVDAVIGAWPAEQTRRQPRAAAFPADPVDPATPAGDTGQALLAVAVDGKTVRGAVDADGAQVHLLAAATHGDQLVRACCNSE